MALSPEWKLLPGESLMGIDDKEETLCSRGHCSSGFCSTWFCQVAQSVKRSLAVWVLEDTLPVRGGVSHSGVFQASDGDDVALKFTWRTNTPNQMGDMLAASSQVCISPFLASRFPDISGWAFARLTLEFLGRITIVNYLYFCGFVNLMLF